MRIVNFGSLNIDHVYSVAHFVRPGETLAGANYRRFAGGKGFNQSMALALAGANVAHAGRVGADGAWLRERLERAGVDVRHVTETDAPTGHAVIQVTPEGENAIVLCGGANRTITSDAIERVLANFGPGDLLLTQNEISAMPEILRAAAERGLGVAFNPAPITHEVSDYPLDAVDLFVLNALEAEGLSGAENAEEALDRLCARFSKATIVLTLGARGALAAAPGQRVAVAAERVTAVDTTAAGDTFVGYFLAARAEGADLEAALRLGCRAAALCVTRPGAADSIPRRDELA